MSNQATTTDTTTDTTSADVGAELRAVAVAVEAAFPGQAATLRAIADQGADSRMRLKLVEDAINAIDDEHYEAVKDNTKYCGEGSCMTCNYLTRLNDALEGES